MMLPSEMIESAFFFLKLRKEIVRLAARFWAAHSTLSISLKLDQSFSCDF